MLDADAGLSGLIVKERKDARMRKSLGVLTVAGLLTGLAACSSGGQTGGQTGDQTGGQASESAQITLSVAAFEGGGAEIADIPAINADFEKEYPNVTLDYKYVAEGEFDQYNNTRLAAGNAADVLMTNPVRVRQWQSQDYLADLSDQPWVSQMLPNIAPFGEVAGKTYAFTQQNIPIGMYANLDILKAAGIDTVPQTWPEFVTDLQTLKDKGSNGLLLANLTGWTSEQWSLALAANILPENWGAGYDAGTSEWATWAPVIDRTKELLTSGLLDGKLMNGIEPFNTGLSEFNAGEWAFTIQGGWALQTVATTAKFNFSFNPVPGGDAGTEPKTFTFIGSGWGVNNASTHLQAAKDYVNFMTLEANDSRYLKAENCFSTLKNVPSPQMENATAIVDAFNDGRTSPSQVEFIKFPSVEKEFWNVGMSLFNDPSQATGDLLNQLEQAVPRTE